MQAGEKTNVYRVYDKIAHWFAQNRPQDLIEKRYLDNLINCIPDRGSVLDVGCGTGRPILEYLINKSLTVTGIDASIEMLNIARADFPSTEFFLQDMRSLALPRKFDAIIAWHSLFHLPAVDQPAMFQRFSDHLNPGGILLFTSGDESGEAWGINGEENLFHASLNSADYAHLLTVNKFSVLEHVVNDPDYGYATVWIARYEG